MERSRNNPGSVRVVVGAHNKNVGESTQQKLTARRIIMHPNYKQGGALNADVALIELSSPVRFNDRVVRSCMPQQGVYPATGKNCYIAGEFLQGMIMVFITALKKCYTYIFIAKC